jgi:hypothetical protein
MGEWRMRSGAAVMAGLCLCAVAARAQERVATPAWFDEVDPRAQTDTLSYRKGAVAINVLLFPKTHTATGSVAVYGSWVDCAVTSAFLVDQAGQKESLTGQCPQGGPTVGVFQSAAGSTTLGHVIAHATSLQFVQGGHSVAVELTGLRDAFARAAAYQQASPGGAGASDQAGQ